MWTWPEISPLNRLLRRPWSWSATMSNLIILCLWTQTNFIQKVLKESFSVPHTAPSLTVEQSVLRQHYHDNSLHHHRPEVDQSHINVLHEDINQATWRTKLRTCSTKWDLSRGLCCCPFLSTSLHFHFSNPLRCLDKFIIFILLITTLRNNNTAAV